MKIIEAYQTEDGKIFVVKIDALKHEAVLNILKLKDVNGGLASWVVSNHEAIFEILQSLKEAYMPQAV